MKITCKIVSASLIGGVMAKILNHIVQNVTVNFVRITTIVLTVAEKFTAILTAKKLRDGYK